QSGVALGCVVLLDKGPEVLGPGEGSLLVVLGSIRELAEGVVMIVRRQANLLEVVLALHAVGGLAHLLHSRQQESDKDCDDRNHDQELDQGKRRETTEEATRGVEDRWHK